MSKKKPETAVEEPEKDPMEQNRFFEEETVEYLKHVFSEKEKTDMGEKLAQCFADCAGKEADLKSVSTQLKSEVAKIQGEMSALSGKIREGYEHRNIKCKKRFDYRLGMVEYIRLDTGEIVRERPLDEEERQRTLNLKSKSEEEQEFQEAAY